MSGDGNEPSTGPDVGTLAEEAAKLLGALSGWAKDATHDLGVGVEEHPATGADECRYCPVCRTVHALRGTSPEVRAQLATAATSLLQAASAMLATAVPDQHQHSGGVEHIDLDDQDDQADWPDDDRPEEGDR